MLRSYERRRRPARTGRMAVIVVFTDHSTGMFNLRPSHGQLPFQAAGAWSDDAVGEAAGCGSPKSKHLQVLTFEFDSRGSWHRCQPGELQQHLRHDDGHMDLSTSRVLAEKRTVRLECALDEYRLARDRGDLSATDR